MKIDLVCELITQPLQGLRVEAFGEPQVFPLPTFGNVGGLQPRLLPECPLDSTSSFVTSSSRQGRYPASRSHAVWRWEWREVEFVPVDEEEGEGPD